jgi:signal transduction histidine kinase
MTAQRMVMLAAGGVLLLLTYLLIEGTGPDAARHERTLDALRAAILDDAALQRDVLQARSGLLRNYDPLVQSIENLHRAVDELRTAGQTASGDVRDEIDRRVDSVATAVADQEMLVEQFKSSNALLQNSLSYFMHMSQQFRPAGADNRDAVMAEMGTLTNAMLRLTSDPRGEMAAEVTASLDRLAQLPFHANWRDSLGALEIHGRLIVATLPPVDSLVSRVLAAPIAERTRDLQNVYLAFHGAAVQQANLFRILLYVAAVALAAYVGYLFVRLRANARAREALQARLHQAQRLEAVGTLAGGIAHEFNNVLGAMLGHAEMALMAPQRDGPALRHVRQIMKAGERARTVIDQVLTFSHRQEVKHRPILAEPVVSEAVELLRASLPATVSVQTRLRAGDARLQGDPAQLQQVVMNLCTNAAQAMDNRGVIGIDLDTIDTRVELSLSHGSLAAGRYVRLAVADTGHGIDAATMQRMFEPFFTTKAAGSGTGLGLPTVHGIVTEHGGAIDVQSTRGSGTRFTAYLPQTDAAAWREGDSMPSAPPGNGQTVLLVDDEKSLVLLGEEMLAVLGYEPVGFDNSRLALAAFRADPQRFDLVLTDEVMPDMTGTELAGAMHQLRPDLPIVLMTGHIGHAENDRARPAGIREVIKKPLLSAAIAQCLARHLH